MGANASEGFHRRAAAAAMVGMIIVGVVCVLCNIVLAGRHWPPENRSARPSGTGGGGGGGRRHHAHDHNNIMVHDDGCVLLRGVQRNYSK